MTVDTDLWFGDGGRGTQRLVFGGGADIAIGAPDATPHRLRARRAPNHTRSGLVIKSLSPDYFFVRIPLTQWKKVHSCDMPRLTTK